RRATTAPMWATPSGGGGERGFSGGGSWGGGPPPRWPPRPRPRRGGWRNRRGEGPRRTSQVGGGRGQGPVIEPSGLGLSQEGLQVRLDRLPGELVPDPPGEVADLEEVEEPLEPDRAAPLTDGQLERRAVGRDEHLGEGVDLQLGLGQ